MIEIIAHILVFVALVYSVGARTLRDYYAVVTLLLAAIWMRGY